MQNFRKVLVLLALGIALAPVAAVESIRGVPWSPFFPIQLALAGGLFFLVVPRERRRGLFHWNTRGFLVAMGLLVLSSILLSFLGQWIFEGIMKLPVREWDYLAYFKQIYPTMTQRWGVPGADLLMIIFLLVMAPIGEELFYRGVLWREISLESRWAAYGVSTACFALRHALQLTFFWPSYPLWVGVFYAIITIMSGLILARTLEKTGSLLPGMAAHSGINAILVTLALLYFKGVIAL